MTKQELIEKLREHLVEYAEEAEWYRTCYCNHLFELCVAKRRAVWDMMDIIQKAESKTALIQLLEMELYHNDSVDFYVQKNLLGLAELADAKRNTIYSILALAHNELNDFS